MGGINQELIEQYHCNPIAFDCFMDIMDGICSQGLTQYLIEELKNNSIEITEEISKLILSIKVIVFNYTDDSSYKWITINNNVKMSQISCGEICHIFIDFISTEEYSRNSINGLHSAMEYISEVYSHMKINMPIETFKLILELIMKRKN